MQIAVIGTGFVGVVTAGVFAKFGNTVHALDIDEEKIKLLKQGKLPFFEPHLEELVTEATKAGRLKFTTSYKSAISNAEIIFICVGTPSFQNGQADLSFVFSAAKSLANHIKNKAIVVIKSTVPPSTNKKVQDIIRKETRKKFYIASVPEFLKEGSAVQDTLKPDRLVLGTDVKWVADKLLDLHKPIGGRKIIVSPESAQITKYASNAYLATRIAFVNEIANLCEKTGADIEEVIQGLGADERIGSHYWYPGPGYGGSCFPKDVKELSNLSRSVGEKDGLFEKIDKLNENRINRLLKKYEKRVKGFSGKRIAILGLSFKPNTDDLREAPSTKFIPYLIKSGAKIKAYDPKAINMSKKVFKKKISYAKNAYDAAEGSDILLLLVEWDEFKQLNLRKLKDLMRGNLFIDTRNLYDSDKVKAIGFKYIGIGR